MLSISKLRVGQEAYQLSGVAQSLDDYYTGAGEAAGQWAGTGSVRLGLEGEVAADDLRAVLAGIRPGTGGLDPNGEQIRPHPRRVPGFDLTFKAPKSVSVLYAVSDDPRVQGAIIEAGEAAVRAALGWLEREAVHVRRGSGDKRWLADLAVRDPAAAAAAAVRVLPGGGLVAAMFRHRTSRSGDPLLHWHTLVANMTEGPDGRWSALVTPDLYRGARAAGEVFQTVLRDELSASLGIDWRPGRHVPEVAGVPERLCEAFSKRSREVEGWLEATGTPGDAAGRQAAVLATRRNKPEVEDERFDAAWKAEAIDAGWGPDAAEALVASLTPGRESGEQRWLLTDVDTDEYGHSYRYGRVVDREEWIADLLRRDLTATSSTFTMAQLVQAVAARLTEGASVDLIERTVARVLASPLTVPVDGSQRRWTTTELLGVEERFLATLVSPPSVTGDSSGMDDEVAVSPIEEVIASRPTLGHDQAAAVRSLADAGPVSVLVGPAGTGKTYALDALRETLEHSGMTVRGAAPSARAALELQAGAHLPSATLHRLLGRWARGEDAPTHRTVLVVDEAGMASIRDLEAVVSRVVGAGGRVVLSGDHHQLPEVGPGGGFAAAVDRCETVAELHVNRRQRQGWEQAALERLRHGEVARAVEAYRRHERLVVADDPAAAIGQAVALWRDAVAAGQRPVLLAGTTATVDALNEQVRALLIEDGTLTGEVIGKWSGRDFTVGDRVVLRANSYHEVQLDGAEVAVLNGQGGTVVAGDPSGLSVHVDGHDVPVHLAAAYLDAGGIDHGYALTTHRAQGGTWDLAIAVGSQGLYREAAYVQFSRGRNANVLVLARQDADAFDAELVRHDHGLPLPAEGSGDPYEELIEQVQRSGAKTLVLADDPEALSVHRLATTMTLADIEARAARARRIEAQARAVMGVDPAAAAKAIDRAHHTATHIADGMQVKAYDRRNIGTVEAVHDHDGTASIRFVSASGTNALRVMPWDLLQIVTPRNPAERTLSREAQTALEWIVTPNGEAIHAVEGLLAQHDVCLGDAERWERAAEGHIQRSADALAADPPGWLTELIGLRPEWPAAAQVWDDALRSVAAAMQRSSRPAALEAVGAAASWLLEHLGPEVAKPVRRPPAELERRRQELAALLGTAPPDRRGVVRSLVQAASGTTDSAAGLLAAVEAQATRDSWIATHWPHVVEAQALGGSVNETLSVDDSGVHTTTAR